MVKISSRQAIVYAAIIFILSAFLNFLFPHQSVVDSGFVVSILLTVFVLNNYVTIFAAVAASIAILSMSASHEDDFFSTDVLSGNIFLLVIIAFTTLIVLYTKRLIRHMQFDKTHMTSLFENATEGIILTNGKGEIILVNPSAQNIFGYGEEELTGKLIEILIPQRFRPHHHELREGFYHHPQNRQMGSGRDLFARRKDGTDFPVEVSLSHYKQKEESFVIAFVVDITARKNIELNIQKHQAELENLTENMRLLNSQLEMKVDQRTQILTEALQNLEVSQQELSEALEKEKELSEIKSRFVSMASHEFRTPLSTVLSSASLLSRYTAGDEQQKRDKHIERIKGSVRHLNDILEDFLSLGKLDEGKIIASKDNFDLAELLGDVVEEMRAQLKAGQRIEFNYSGSHNIYSDKKLLRNIAINLVSNAIKFSDEEKTMWIECRVAGGVAVLSIRDEGIGISKEDQQYLFSSFFRGANALNIQGTGLGLHIVKRYVDLLSGNINLQTALNEGTTISINFPVNNQIS